MSVADSIIIAASPKKEEKKPAGPAPLTTFERLLSGFVAGTFARTITSPLDVLKMLMQVSAKGGSMGDTIKKLWAESGIAGFWRGNVAACVRLGPQSAIKFFAFDELQRIVGKGKPLTGIQRTICGSSAGVISQALTYPLDVIRTRITVNPKKYTGIVSGLVLIAKEEGIKGMFSGLGTTIIGVIPYEGAQFFAQGYVRQLITKQLGVKSLTPFQNCIVGSVAGLFSQTFSYPFDVVRKRQMLLDQNGKPLYNGMFDCFGKTIAKEGFFGLYRGFGLNCVKGVPFAALQYTFLEETKKVIYRYHAAHPKTQ